MRVLHFSTAVLTCSSMDLSIVCSRLSSLLLILSVAWVDFRMSPFLLFATGQVLS